MGLRLAAAALLFAACGDNSFHPTDTVSWEERAPIGSGPRLEAGVVELDGRMYVLGGFDASSHITAEVAVYDPELDAWSEAAAMPRAMHHLNAVAAGGRIAVLGGLAIDFTAIGDVFLYDPDEDEWSPGTAMPAGSERGAAAVGALGDQIVVAGGSREDADDRVSVYSLSEDRWSERAPLPAPTYHAVGVVSDGVLYAIGGLSFGLIDGSSHALTTLYSYDPDADTWRERAAMPTARGGCAAGVVGSRILCAGGEADTSHHGGIAVETEAYDPASDRWTVLEHMRTPRGGTGGASIGDRLYVPGGARILAFAPLDTNEVYITPSSPSSSPPAR
jgi:N-acetylneuraminic acid mutarotase